MYNSVRLKSRPTSESCLRLAKQVLFLGKEGNYAWGSRPGRRITWIKCPQLSIQHWLANQEKRWFIPEMVIAEAINRWIANLDSKIDIDTTWLESTLSCSLPLAGGTWTQSSERREQLWERVLCLALMIGFCDNYFHCKGALCYTLDDVFSILFVLIRSKS